MYSASSIIGTKQAADILGVSVSTIYRMIDQGLLTPTKTPGGQRRFDYASLLTFKESSKDFVAPQNPYSLKNKSVANPWSENSLIEEESQILASKGCRSEKYSQ